MRLKRVRTCNKQLDSQGYIYVRPHWRRRLKASDAIQTAAVVKLDPAFPEKFIRRRDAVILPPQWREFLMGSDRHALPVDG